MATQLSLPSLNQHDANNNQHDSQDNDDLSASASTIQTTPTKRQRNKDNWQRLLQDTLLWEFGSALFSTCCFVSICAVLFAYDGKVRPTWKLGLSLNAAISILATRCRSALTLVVSEAVSQLKWLWAKDGEPKQLLGMQAFDNASRGPLGALTMLFKYSGRSLVSLGAALTILMLAFEPFVQQILSYPLQYIEDASMPAVTFQSRAGPLYFADFPGGQTALYRALWSSNLELQPLCPSGYCTWEPFPSLGYCSHCEDMTSDLRLVCEPPSVNETRNPSDLFAWCNITLPSSNLEVFELGFGISTDEGDLWQSVHLPHIYIWGTSYRAPNSPSTMNRTVQDPLWSLASAEWDFDPEAIDPPGESHGPPNVTQGMILKKASECTLKHCLSEYNMSVVNHTVPVDTVSVDYGEFFFIDDDTFWYVNKTVCWKPTSAPTDPTMEQATPDHFTDSEIFTGISRAQYYYQVQDGDFIWGGDPRVETPFATHDRIIDMTLQGTFDNIVAALNQYSLETNNYIINGTACSLQVHVRVQWLWLLLPALFVLLGDAFFLLTLQADRKQKGPCGNRLFWHIFTMVWITW
ncbi:hypothetical protein BJX66DRAFT_344155 [Aspergillus keveii]|uniref:Uncharacterized protein n=1 Tax=Aspergillus keveii TaxID=714993 RepID=A0ABR4FM74_9EURO